jgi:Xaa-Pro aminopeptidase
MIKQMNDPHAKRIAAARRRLKRQGLDAMLFSNLVNIRHLVGYSGSSGLLWLTDRRAVFLTDFRYQEQCRQEVRGARTAIIKRSLWEDLFELTDIGRRTRLGFEHHHLSFAQHETLQRKLPRCKLVPVRGLAEGLRAIKGAGEIAAIARAAAIADAAFAVLVKRLKPGLRENAVAAELDYLLQQQGAQKPSFDTIVASGPNSALPHARPGDRTLRRGDFVVCDFGAQHRGYCSDMTRTVCIGRTTAHQRELYALVQRAQLAGLRAVRPGAVGRDVDAAARRIIDGAGHAEHYGHGLGHGVGLEVHEAPRLGKLSDDVLAAGHVVTVEPGVYLPGEGGVRIEDLVAVTAAGCRILTKTAKELISIN